jgi:hypothetical protein
MKSVFVPAVLALVVAAPLAGIAGQQSQSHTSRSEVTWINDDGGERMEVRIREDVHLTDDWSAIASMGPGSSLLVEERTGGTTRSVRAEPGAGGPSYRYSLNGRPAEFDARARAWFSSMLRRAVTEGGLYTHAWAERLLAQRGPAGLVDELPKLKSDHAKSLFIAELTKSGSVDRELTRRVLREIASGVGSDHYKQLGMTSFAGAPLADPEVRAAYFAAAGTIGSDHYRSVVLGAAIDNHASDGAVLRGAVDAAKAIGSDHYKAGVLKKVAENMGGDTSLRDAILEASRTIGSDYERGQVLLLIFPRER